ncbi:MAG: phosphoglucosamine mutase [Oscillospiraceae bacterium]|nr:phosphoglucosamine mutase [Oscillospiraceae bacterium]
MARLFGTDGIRGIANDDLDAMTAYRVGQSAAVILTGQAKHRPSIVIGKDTRISSDMLESALIAGVTSAGADVILCGTAPTPAVAYLTLRHADAGIVISASHNPFEYNGIKIFDQDGYKLPDELEDKIEAQMSKNITLKKGVAIGRVLPAGSCGLEEYIEHLHQAVPADLGKLKIVVDCANGAASATAKALFSRYCPAALEILCHDPNGVNINDCCGSTHMESLRKRVLEGGFDIGIAFDGDADRCLALDNSGGIIDGDRIMAVCAKNEQLSGHLPDDTFVATVMSNLGLHTWVKNAGLRMACTAVGDRYVLERMRDKGYLLGGEQSGHVIFSRHSTTGDGQLTALKFLSILALSRSTSRELVNDIPYYPQVLLNLEVTPELKEFWHEKEEIAKAITKAELELGNEGRVLVRPSGTEALIRVMVEGKDLKNIQSVAEYIGKAIREA